MGRPVVLVFIGSRSDLEAMAEARRTLDWFGVPVRVVVASAHREPDRVRALARKARGEGVKVVIAAAGMAAHLAGAIAAQTTLPVIGVPLETEPFGALDSLLSTVNMPAGVPVAVVSPGRAGAVNAALLAVEMLSLTDKSLGSRLDQYRKGLASGKAARGRVVSRESADVT
ncbi:MAG: 5-(carboxyamino)imidazole ribonucleotide mutase [Candidatus Eisenbacteria bacterium]|nr:5-(carboxyamino)imidazole ribonucleotide mutase [Candidatus Eisenbacteria bacterium]